MRTAVYRIHYGYEILMRSIQSIHRWADKIVVYYDDTSWYDKNTIEYLGKIIDVKHPENPRLTREYMNNSKLTWIADRRETPVQQFGDYATAQLHDSDFVLLMEPDMVFPNVEMIFEAETNHVTCFKQIEFWKGEDYQIPLRDRIGPVLIKGRGGVVRTRLNNTPLNMPNVTAPDRVYNYGFALRNSVLLYKHLLALGFSKKIGDSIPSERWYEDKWLNWTPDTKGLEPAASCPMNIPHAIKVER